LRNARTNAPLQLLQVIVR